MPDPSPIDLADERVRLRPFRPSEFETVWAAHRPGHVARGRSLPEAKRRLRRMFDDSGSFDVDVVYLAIEAAGVLVGEVDVRRVGSTSSRAFEVGIELYDPAARGRGLGGDAFGLVVRYLFEAASARRVEASTGSANTPMRRILERLGFACTAESASRVHYACTRRDWQERQARTRGR